MTAKGYMESFAESRGLWDKEKACQAYVIALGVNDVYNRNMEIGSFDDIDREDYSNLIYFHMNIYIFFITFSLI